MLLLKTLPSVDGANKGVASIGEYVQRIQSQLSLIGHAWFYIDVINVWRQLPLRLNTRDSPLPALVAPLLPTRLTAPLGMLIVSTWKEQGTQRRPVLSCAHYFQLPAAELVALVLGNSWGISKCDNAQIRINKTRIEQNVGLTEG